MRVAAARAMLVMGVLLALLAATVVVGEGSDSGLEDEAPGWEAIDAALEAVHGDQEPAHFAPELPPFLGGDYPFDGVSLYRGSEPEHWHVVTYGLTELYTKDSLDAELSGFGFELTLRLPPGASQEALATANWLLAPLGKYVRESGKSFGHGHLMPMDFQKAVPGAKLGGLAFRLDPQLDSIETPHGRVEFLQVVGITRAELDQLRTGFRGRAATDCLFEVLERDDPMLVLDLQREAVFESKEAREALRSCLASL